MTRPKVGQPDLDHVLAAVVKLIEAATYADAVRRADEVAISYEERRPAAQDLRNNVTLAEADARTALYDAVGHDRAMRLIPAISRVRYEAAAQAEAAYEALPVDLRDDDGIER